MTSTTISYRTVDVGYQSDKRPAMVYVGTLTDGGQIPTALGPGDVYQVLVVGWNTANPSHSCMLFTLDPALGTIASKVIQCPLPANNGYAPAARIGDTVYVFGGKTSGDSLFTYSIEHETWTQVEKGGVWPGARYCHSSFTLGGKLYIAGGRGARDCWCYDPETGVWTRQADIPLKCGSSATTVVGDVVHMIGTAWSDKQPHFRLHLTFTLSRGWHREADLPSEYHNTGCVSVGSDIYLLGGPSSPRGVRVYNTHTKQWRHGRDLPVPSKSGRACLISPRVLLLCSEQMVVGEIPESHQERRERERRERESLVSALVSLGVPAEDLPHSPTPITLATCLPLLGGEITRLKETVSEIQRQDTADTRTFSCFSPDSLPLVQALIEQARGIDMAVLRTHLSRLSTYLPLARSLSLLVSRVQQVITEHPMEELPTEDCSALLTTLTSEHTALHTAYQGVRALDFDPAESVAYLKGVADLLETIDKTPIIPLPSDYSSLPLNGKRQYFQAKQFNGAVESLCAAAGEIIECQATVDQHMSGLAEVETPDPDVCDRVMAEAKALLQILSYLAPRRTRALSLVAELEGVQKVNPGAIDVAQRDVADLEWHLTRPRLPEKERQTLTSDLVEWREMLNTLQRAQSEREQLIEQLQGYVIFPEVAAALGVERQPLEEAVSALDKCNGVVGVMVKGEIVRA
ncbi:hypothetical protein KIPB_005314 [Kipferlia bialata]|uniref:Uncharacterized protein n=1 Tax=Kipferlia bialata TaxID=797122 RepID=A0A9K3GH83_9EUKA|nr:hypothetical protein KIPB_005314 [Kipferlia bialata]|eukprot:g5314.t1